MVYYEIWFNLKDSSKDLELSDAIQAYLGMMQKQAHIQAFQLKRRMLGLGPNELGEFHLTISVDSMAQLEEAFQLAATRGPEVEPEHRAVYSLVKDLSFGLTRDFPDTMRVRT